MGAVTSIRIIGIKIAALAARFCILIMVMRIAAPVKSMKICSRGGQQIIRNISARYVDFILKIYRKKKPSNHDKIFTVIMNYRVYLSRELPQCGRRRNSYKLTQPSGYGLAAMRILVFRGLPDQMFMGQKMRDCYRGWQAMSPVWSGIVRVCNRPIA